MSFTWMAVGGSFHHAHLLRRKVTNLEELRQMRASPTSRLANGGQEWGQSVCASPPAAPSLRTGPRAPSGGFGSRGEWLSFNLMATSPLGREANAQLQQFLKFRTLECSCNKIPGQLREQTRLESSNIKGF